jgi:hypothetical protein
LRLVASQRAASQRPATMGADGEPTTRPKSRKPKYTRFSQQQLRALRPALTLELTAKLCLIVGTIFMALGATTYTGVKSLHTVVKRYDDVVDCTSGFFPTEAERELKMSNDGAGTTCSIEFDAETTLEKPVYVYYELSNFFQNHRAFVRDLDYFELMGSSSSGSLCTTHTSTESGGEIKPCGVQAWSYFNDSYAVALDGAAVDIDETNISWKSDRKYRFGSYAAENLNDDAATRGGSPVSGNIDEDEHFVTWMRTAALSKFRKLWGKIDTDIPKGARVRITIDNRYNTYKFDGTKSIVLATNGWVGGKNLVLPALYFLDGSICIITAVVCIVMSCSKSKKYAKE